MQTAALLRHFGSPSSHATNWWLTRGAQTSRQELQLVASGAPFFGTQVTVGVPQAIRRCAVVAGSQRKRFEQVADLLDLIENVLLASNDSQRMFDRVQKLMANWLWTTSAWNT